MKIPLGNGQDHGKLHPPIFFCPVDDSAGRKSEEHLEVSTAYVFTHPVR